MLKNNTKKIASYTSDCENRDEYCSNFFKGTKIYAGKRRKRSRNSRKGKKPKNTKNNNRKLRRNKKQTVKR